MSEEKHEYEPEHEFLYDNDDDLCHEPELEDACLLENDYLEDDSQHHNPHINDEACAQGATRGHKGYQPVSQSRGVSENPVIPPPKKP